MPASIAEILAPGAGEIRAVACPHPFRVESITRHYPAGLSLAEILEDVQPRAALRRRAHVAIDDWEIPPEMWGRVRPRPGRTVTVRVVPADGGDDGGKNPLRTVLSLAVLAASFAFAPQLAGVFGVTSRIGVRLFQAGLGLVGSLLVNAIAPPPSPNLRAPAALPGRDPIAPTITGSRNVANRFGVVPKIYGRHKVFPPLGGREYTEILGPDQFFRQLFVVGIGEYDITDLRIGTTPIGSFQDVQWAIRPGTPGDPPVSLYTDDVVEDSLSVALTAAAGWQTRTTGADAEEISVDAAALQGMTVFNNDGSRSSRSVTINVEYRPAGGGAWTNAGDLVITDNSTSAVRRGKRWSVAKDQYEVRVRRATADTDDSRILDKVWWTTLRTIRHPAQIVPPGVATIEVLIKASGQLQGSIDRLNCIAHSILPDWDEATQTWIKRATASHAAAFRDVLQGGAFDDPMPDSDIDLADLQDWAEAVAADGLEFNFVVDEPTTQFELLRDIAAAGKASHTMKDGRQSVVRDFKQTAPIQMFTPRNSWGFRGMKTFVTRQPHGFRVQFLNSQTWQQDERLVYADGFNENNATDFEVLRLIGAMDPDQAWLMGRYFIAAGKLRPETHQLNTGVEQIVCRRGSLVAVNHDVLLVGLGAARIKALQTDVNGDVTQITVDELLTMESGKTYGVVIRTEGDVALAAQLTTAPGETSVLDLSAPIPAAQAPAVGDLLSFGEAGQETADYTVTGILPRADGSAVLTLVDHAPAVHESGMLPVTFTASDVDPVGDVINLAVAFFDGDILQATTTGTLPGGIAPATDHFVVNRTETGFQVSLSEGGAPVDLTDGGTGTHTWTRQIPPFQSNVTLPPDLAESEPPPAPVVLQVFADARAFVSGVDGKLQRGIVVAVSPPSSTANAAVRLQARFRRSDADPGSFKILSPVPADTLEVAAWPVEDGVEYHVDVRSVAGNGTPSAWVPAAADFLVSSPAPNAALVPRVTGLELFDGANGTTFTGRDAKFVWRASSATNASELGGEPDGGDSGTLDFFFKDYEVRVLALDGSLLRTEHVSDASYTYTFERNVEDGGPRRAFAVEVFQRGEQNQLSAQAARIEVSNPAPPLPRALSVRASFKTIFVEHTAPDDADFEGVVVWLSTQSGFTPGPATRAYKGPDRLIALDAQPGTQYFVRVGAFDAFGEAGMQIGGELSVQTGSIETSDIADAAIGTAKIADLAVDSAKIADGSVVNAKIAAAAVDSAKIQDAAVTNAKIGNLEVDTAKIKDLSVTTIKVAQGAITNVATASTGAETALSGGTPADPDDQIQEVTITNVDSASSLKIDYSFTARLIADPTFDKTFELRFQLRRGPSGGSTVLIDEMPVDGTVIAAGGSDQFVTVSGVFTDSPGAGDHRYALVATEAAGNGNIGAKDRKIDITDFKR